MADDIETPEDGVTETEVEEAAEETPDEPEHPPCPTCNEEWDGDAVFCSYCGYEEKDEANPLHPLPIIDEGVCDAAGILSENEISELKGMISGLKGSGPVMFATFNTPEDQTPGGIAFSLYNCWTTGADKADEGLLLYYDPVNHRVEVVTGRSLGKGTKVNEVMDAAADFADSIAGKHLVEGFRTAVGKLMKV